MDLIAPSAAWMRDFAPFRDIEPDDPWLSVAKMPPQTLLRIGVEDITLRQFRRQMRKFATLPLDDPERIRGEELWRPAIVGMKQQAAEVFDSEEAVELNIALDAGAVTLISDGTRLEDAADQQIDWFRSRLENALNNPNSTVLFDELASLYLRASGSYADGLPTLANSRTKRTTVGAGLVERLPSFPNAPMSDVLEAREELAEGRAAYRVSVRHLSDKLESSALDPTLPSEIEELWNDEVRPALANLRRTATATKVGVETSKRLVTEGFGLPSILPSILVAVANFTDLAAALPPPAAAATLVGRVAAAGAHEAIKARSAVRHHDLVYLLDVNKKLGNRPFN